jgi:hypothetical protein
MQDSDLKKGGVEIYLYYWVIPIFVLLILININVPYLRFEGVDFGDIDFMISVVTFLFGFLISISFSMILNRVGVLKESLAIETGRLASLFLLSKNLGKKFSEKIKERIDDYTIVTIRNYQTYEFGRDAVYGIYDDTVDMELKTELQKQNAASFFYILGEFEPSREKLEYLTRGKLLPAMKWANYVLATLLIGLLFLNRGDSFSNWLFVVLSTVIIFILLIIEDYEDLRIGDYVNNISNSEQLFDLIGKERYYPKYLLGRVKLMDGRNYRIGFYDKKIGREEIVSLKYTPKFFFKVNDLVERFRKKKKINVEINDSIKSKI